MKSNILTLFLIASAFMIDSSLSDEPAKEEIKQLKIVGNPDDYESISVLLMGLYVQDDELFETVEQLAKTKPLHAPGTGIGIGGPKAILHVATSKNSTSYSIELYVEKDGLMILSSKTKSDDGISYQGRSIGWYEDADTYKMANLRVVNILRKLVEQASQGEEKNSKE
jgi:hypothetical protein